MENDKVNLNGFLKKLVDHELLKYETACQAQRRLTQKSFNLATFLVGNEHIKPKVFATEAAKEFSMHFLDLNDIETNELPDTISHEIIESYRVVPLEIRGKELYLASASPIQTQALKDITFSTSKIPHLIIVEYDKLEDLISNILDRGTSLLDDLDEEGLDEFDIAEEIKEDDVDLTSVSDNDAPIVKWVNMMLLNAIKKKASDIHFEPYEKRYRVRYRIDGILTEVGTMSKSQAGTIAARLKVMSDMDIAERRVPQDGRVKMKVSSRKAIDFRVNTCPTSFGEKIVLRILDGDAGIFDEESMGMLGYTDEQKKMYLNALKKPQGMILVTGPTGSGKTVSLYTGLNILNKPERNISTAEDPVEINMDGVNQVNINNKTGMDFPSALRAFLRQDPDVIMVGEIRDLDTASISIKAAQTGHLVLSTLHTNNAAETLNRLAQMGVPLFNVATAVQLIVAQRLARKLCNNCKEEMDIPFSALKDDGISQDILEENNAKFYRANDDGCSECTNGYKGRVGIYEVVEMNQELSGMILREANALELSAKMREQGYDSLRLSAMKKAMQGLISLEEVYRVTVD